MFVQIPPRSVIAHYAKSRSGSAVAVFAVDGRLLGKSFHDLRNQFSFVAPISGPGRWVILAPMADPLPTQERLI